MLEAGAQATAWSPCLIWAWPASLQVSVASLALSQLTQWPLQVLAVAGTVGVFGLWHFSKRRRGSAPPLLQRGYMSNPVELAAANLRKLLRARGAPQRSRSEA